MGAAWAPGHHSWSVSLSHLSSPGHWGRGLLGGGEARQLGGGSRQQPGVGWECSPWSRQERAGGTCVSSGRSQRAGAWCCLSPTMPSALSFRVLEETGGRGALGVPSGSAGGRFPVEGGSRVVGNLHPHGCAFQVGLRAGCKGSLDKKGTTVKDPQVPPRFSHPPGSLLSPTWSRPQRPDPWGDTEKLPVTLGI